MAEINEAALHGLAGINPKVENLLDVPRGNFGEKFVAIAVAFKGILEGSVKFDEGFGKWTVVRIFWSRIFAVKTLMNDSILK